MFYGGYRLSFRVEGGHRRKEGIPCSQRRHAPNCVPVGASHGGSALQTQARNATSLMTRHSQTNFAAYAFIMLWTCLLNSTCKARSSEPYTRRTLANRMPFFVQDISSGCNPLLPKTRHPATPKVCPGGFLSGKIGPRRTFGVAEPDGLPLRVVLGVQRLVGHWNL